MARRLADPAGVRFLIGPLVAGWASARQQDLVDDMNDTVICLNVGDDDIRAVTGAVGDRYATTALGDAKAFGCEDRLEVVRPAGDHLGRQFAIIDMIQKNIRQLAAILRLEQGVDRTLRQVGKGAV